MEIKLDIDINNNYITICGENNTGKTNILRAINLFFNPNDYDPFKDSPYHKIEGSRGASVYPEITIDFNESGKHLYRITRQFSLDGLKDTFGYRFYLHQKKKRKKINVSTINSILNKIVFFFIESANISLPNLLNNLIEDLYDIEFARTRFSGPKKKLKKAFDEYISGLLSVLSDLANEINPLFRDYKENWGISFDIQSDVKKFRDIITDDIFFYINDQSNRSTEGKGSGLQRLAYLLLHFRIIEKIKNKTPIVAIDEPDVFIHNALQKKLKSHLIELLKHCQVIITTHSPIFINSYTLNNVFLLELEITERTYKRKGKKFSILNTKNVYMDDIDGAKSIRKYLGIEDHDYNLLDKFNIMVEGEDDRKYIIELLKYFNLPIPRIEPAFGVTNYPAKLDFYESFYENREDKPFILVLFDNDSKGREIFKKITKKCYNKIKIKPMFIPNFLGNFPDITNLDKVKTNNEIEDFVYPGIICELANKILELKKMKLINKNTIISRIHQPAHIDNGILFMLENEKNNTNPTNGLTIKFDSIQVKSGMSNLFSIEGNKKIIRIIDEQKSEYPKVFEFLKIISNPNNIFPDNNWKI